MNLVLDASAAASIVTDRDPGNRLTRMLSEAELVYAPDLLVAELCNTFWKYQQFDSVGEDRCAEALRQAIGLADVLVPCAELHEEVFALACRAGHPAYDLFYLVLARRHAAALATADRKLKALARKLKVRISG